MKDKQRIRGFTTIRYINSTFYLLTYLLWTVSLSVSQKYSMYANVGRHSAGRTSYVVLSAIC